MTRTIFIRHLILAVCAVLLADPSLGSVAAQATPTHYAFGRPLPASANRTPDFGYPYGGTRRGQIQVHHGMDYSVPRGTPVLAAGAGTVLFAGSDQGTLVGLYNDFYGNVIILQHDLAAPEGGTVFTLYGHLSVIEVKVGEAVVQGQTIGAVGMTGIAQGPHLHFEVRVGDPFNYNAVRNPELWYAPLPRRAKLIGKLVNADGTPTGETRVALASPSRLFYTFTYADPALPSDPLYGENFVIGDLVEGCYQIRVRGKIGYAVDQRECFAQNETRLIEIRLRE